MKTLSSPLPIPVDHNPFDFYSHHEKPPGLERQASKQPTTRSEEDYIHRYWNNRWQKLRSWVKGNGKLFVVKPLLVIAMIILTLYFGRYVFIFMF